MIDGLWTLTTVSPWMRSGSSLRASEPGAPLGQRNTVGLPAGTTTGGPPLPPPPPRCAGFGGAAGCWAGVRSDPITQRRSSVPTWNSRDGFIAVPRRFTLIAWSIAHQTGYFDV